MREEDYGTVDLTKWVLRTKHAPLSASGQYEIVASSVRKSDLRTLARMVYGSGWYRNYELVER